METAIQLVTVSRKPSFRRTRSAHASREMSTIISPAKPVISAEPAKISQSRLPARTSASMGGIISAMRTSMSIPTTNKMR